MASQIDVEMETSVGRGWTVQDAKSKFSEFLDTAIEDGPQIVMRRGVETAVLLPIEHWRRLERLAAPDLKELLLASEPRTDALTPPRRRYRLRPRPPSD